MSSTPLMDKIVQTNNTDVKKWFEAYLEIIGRTDIEIGTYMQMQSDYIAGIAFLLSLTSKWEDDNLSIDTKLDELSDSVRAFYTKQKDQEEW